jgi:hypothetical protein
VGELGGGMCGNIHLTNVQENNCPNLTVRPTTQFDTGTRPMRVWMCIWGAHTLLCIFHGPRVPGDLRATVSIRILLALAVFYFFVGAQHGWHVRLRLRRDRRAP